ncbi:MAG TPA: transposase [Candidatus Kapabacteria bacterium]|nr:transposase [Candidatus Kapabacteria bacterium]
MAKYQNKYRSESARAQWWDYGNEGAYFITICTKNREHFFGEIINGIMHLSHLGVLADVFWHEIPHHSPNVKLGAFVVMPNHIHGILILNDNVGTLNGNVGTLNGNVGTLNGNVGTLHATSLRQQQQRPSSLSQPPNTETITKNQQMANISPQSGTVSAIIRAYKSAVTKHANRLGIENGWQPRFHDHIIRNDIEYQRIHNYIVNNPLKWEKDILFKNKNYDE